MQFMRVSLHLSVKRSLSGCQRGDPILLNLLHIFDFAGFAAYNPAPQPII